LHITCPETLGEEKRKLIKEKRNGIDDEKEVVPA
jgi:hypothetical protein